MRTRFSILLLLAFISFLRAQNPLKIYCIDVNQGSSTLIVSPTNKYILIDAGEYQGNYGDSVYRFIRSLGITHLDHTIATHYHSDHIGGFPVAICSLSGGAGRNDSVLGFCYDRGDIDTFSSSHFYFYKNTIGLKRRTIALGDTINLGGGVIMVCVVKNGKVINGDSVATRPANSDYENFRSLGFILKYGFFEAWIGGDLTGIGSSERDVESITVPVIGDIDLYIANHHGSRWSSTATFLDSIRPEVTVFSQGVHVNNYGHPHQEAINRLINRNCYLYQMNDNPTAGTFSIPDSGKILNTHARIMVTTTNYIVNGDTYLIQGIRRDASVLEIITPKDTINEGATVVPRAKVKNLGNLTESFPIRLQIGSAYNKTKTVFGLAPNDTVTVSFDTIWNAVRGNYIVVCSTEVAQDSNSANNRKSANLTVSFYDSELSLIRQPPSEDTLVLSEIIIPQVIVKDNSAYSYPALTKIFFRITGNTIIYLDSVQRTLSPSQTDTITFTSKPLAEVLPGVYRCSSWVIRNNDQIPDNNHKAHNIYIHQNEQTGWKRLNNISSPSGIKDGAALATVRDNIYAFIGNNQPLLYRYWPDPDTWQNRKNISFGYHFGKLKSKFIRKGSALTYGTDNFGREVIYALKGNNTYEFWKYLIAQDSWIQQDDINDFAFKDGSALAYVSNPPNNKYVYALWGNNKYYLFRAYDIMNNQWITKDSAPRGRDNKKYKDGSCLVKVRDTLYLLKGGAKYNEFYGYDIIANHWTELESIPQSHPSIGKKKKVKSGGSITYHENTNSLYVFKGGGTQEFWSYDINNQCWTPKETIPKYLNNKSIVKSGGSLATLAGTIYAFKGNNTKEYWRYLPPDKENKSITDNLKYPQPASQTGNTIKKELLTNIRFEVFNINGQKIHIDNFSDIELLNNKHLKPGIYFITIVSAANKNHTFTKKIVIPR